MAPDLLARLALVLFLVAPVSACFRAKSDTDRNRMSPGFEGPGVYGYVLDDSTGVPLDSAQVVASAGRSGPQVVVLTSLAGFYAIQLPTSGTYRVSASRVVSHFVGGGVVEVGDVPQRHDLSLARICDWDDSIDVLVPVPC